MNDASDWRDLPGALDLAVFERKSTGHFLPVGHLPEWWPFGYAAAEDGLDLGSQYPLLELFLADCESHWESGASFRMESDVWTETSTRGEEQYLQAVAGRMGGRELIVLRSLPKTVFSYQQLAHDLEIEKDKVERMRRELAELNRELEQKRLEAERATRAKSDFLATMSHEIRTPLNAIIGMADVLSGSELTPEQKKCVEVFQRNGVGLLNLINDILDLSKVEAGKIELEAIEFDLREVIARAAEVIEIRATAKGLWVRHSIAPGVPVFLIGDPNRLRQILINLLGNAIKFTDRGGLTVTVEPHSDGLLRFGVRDTGIGIPESQAGLIFESFTQADSSTTRKYGGTGLGLTISKQLVELMGGRIWVESKQGEGSTFFFTASLCVQADQSERSRLPTEIHRAELSPQIKGLHILLADDSEDNRFLIFSYLKDHQCQIDVAENGEIAAEMFRSGAYDLVLMDIEMPVMDGYESTRAIRRFEQETGARKLPVIALTAHAFADMAAKGHEAGFTDHLTKPIRKTTLLEALARYAPAALAAPLEPAPVRFKVAVPPELEDVAPGYLAKRRNEISQYRQALVSQDFDTIRSLGHKLKGTGGGYGFPQLTSLGSAIEHAAIRKDSSSILTKVDELARYLEAVELEYPI